VVIDDLILGKPKNKKQAREMLERLSGKCQDIVDGKMCQDIVDKVL
jgi:predicted house-cleaning NTP pyrophosphatase (Maf/HAM1 superfamily)